MPLPQIDRDRLLSLFRGMVDIYSPSGKESELAEYLERFLTEHGLPFRRQAVDESRYNLIIAASECVDTLFLGHFDTVPAFDIEQYSFSMKDSICSGLGTADMKSGCAAMIEAFITANENGILPHHVALALVVGEEETGDGTLAILDEYSCTHALVAEPSNLKPCLEHCGYVEMILRAFGYRCHAAMSTRDTNAIRAMLRFLLQLEEHVEQESSNVVMNIRDLYSSEAGFAVPDRCVASIDLHIPPDTCAKDYAAELRRFVEERIVHMGATSYELDFPTLANGYRIEPNHPFARRIEQVYQELGRPWESVPFNSHSDANLLRDAGCSPIVLGPGQLAKAHTRDESIDFEQVVDAAEIYTHLLKAESGNYPNKSIC